MGVQDGFPVSAGYTNPRFISKNTPDVMPFPLGFTGSGAAIADIQVAVNKLYDATGASESTTGTVYNATAGTVSNGDTYEECITILANKFDAATGHKHTGSAGDAPILDVVLTAAVSGTGGTPVFGNITFEAGTGVTINQIGNNFIFNSAAGTTVGASGYAQLSGDVTLVAGTGGITITQSGQNITFNASPGMTLAASGNTPLSGAVTLSQGTGITLTQTGQDIEIAATGGSGLKNYLSTVNGVNGNGNFELGSTSKWSLFNTTLTGVIPTGSISAGAGSITTFAVVSSGQLAGQYSLNVGGSGAITAGQGFISDAFTLDLEDYAKVMQLKFYYEAVTGASNMNFSGTSSNTWAMYLYDVTNNAWVQPTGVYNLIQNSGVGIANGTFQTGASTSQYRLAIICINATAGATNTYFDDFFFGPQITAAGAAMSDWTAYTATTAGFGTVSSMALYWRRVGSDIEIQGSFTTGTVAASPAQLGLPSGLVAATGSSLSNGNVLVGGVIRDTSNNNTAFPIATGGNSYVQFMREDSGIVPLNGNGITVNNAVLGVQIKLPIAGWGAQTVMSNDTDTRVVEASYAMTNNFSVTTSLGVIKYDTKLTDTHAAYDTSTGLFTVPVSGIYRVSAMFATAVETVATNALAAQLNLNKNGSTFRTLNLLIGTGGTNNNYWCNGTTEVSCNAGDTLSVSGKVGTTGNISGTADNYITISRISGPATIAATETVAAGYKTLSSTTITSGTALVFTSKLYDTHNVYNTSTGAYVLPVSGIYRISTGGIYTTTTATNIQIYKNGVLYGDYIGSYGGSTRGLAEGCVQGVAGDSITLIPDASRTAGDTNGTYFIERIGNYT